MAKARRYEYYRGFYTPDSTYVDEKAHRMVRVYARSNAEAFEKMIRDAARAHNKTTEAMFKNGWGDVVMKKEKNK